MRAQAFARMSFSLALSYNRLVFTTADFQEIGRSYSGAALAFRVRCGSVKFGLRGRRSVLSVLHVAVTSFFVTGGALSSCSCRFHGRRGTLELFVQISWQAQHFRAFRADFVAGAAL